MPDHPELHSSTSRTDERRQWARAPADWTVHLSLPEGRFEARMRDISGAGICFFLDRPLSEMTLLHVELELPTPEGPEPLAVAGAVVRCERVSPHLEHYEVALFLHDISDSDRNRIETYVTAALG